MNKKEGFFIIPITKKERDWLYEHGVPYGENGISRTNTHHKHYFLTCTKRNLNMVRQFRKIQLKEKKGESNGEES